MYAIRTSSLIVLLAVCSFTQGVKADSPQVEKTTPPNKTPTQATKLLQDRRPGTVTIKPLTINFSGLTFGMSRKSQLINGWKIDPYRKSFGTFSNQAQAIGTSYDLELGIMVTSSVEVFAIAGVDYQRPFAKVVVSNNNTAPFVGIYDQLSYDFKARHNYGFSLGGRYYWNTKKPWFPFVGVMGTVIRQDAIRANVFEIGPNAFVPNYPPVGFLTLQKKKILWGGTLQMGADYQLSKFVSLTLVAGVQYTPRARRSISKITVNNAGFPPPGEKTISCQDNRNLWSVPFMASLKFTL